VADQDGVSQVEPFDERREVVGIGVHLVAARGPARATMSATVVGDRAVAVGGQEDQLRFPGVGIERPAVTEDDGLSCAPVL